MKKIKFALYEYDTENIGDEVQSIAARQFLPRVDYYINRDIPNKSKFSDNEEVKVIANGWYMHKPQNWPLTLKATRPLLVSMHIDQKELKTTKAFSSQESKAFINDNGRIGARDMATLAFLKNQNIDAYFSGCLTLTMKRDNRYKREDFILLVDVSKKVEDTIRARTKRPIVVLSVYRTPNMSREDKFMLAEYYLYLYQSAHAVVTTRLHVMLPSLAFETPVVLIKEEGKFEAERYEGLAELVRSFEESEFIDNPSLFDVDNPPRNSTKYLKIRASLTSKCREYTGFEADSYMTIDLSTLYANHSLARLLGNGCAATYRELLLLGDVKWAKTVEMDTARVIRTQERVIGTQERDIEKFQEEIIKLRGSIKRMESSMSWRVTSPIRYLKRFTIKSERTR